MAGAGSGKDLVVGKINRFLHLKVLSSEMDPTEIRLIRKVFTKEVGAKGF
jgi:hypothetical protein